jgi:hypothetical protein
MRDSRDESIPRLFLANEISIQGKGADTDNDEEHRSRRVDPICCCSARGPLPPY